MADVVRCRRRSSGSAVRLRGRVLGMLRTKIDYDIGDLARIAAHRLLGVPLPEQDDDVLVCSAFAALVYLTCGWQPRHLLPSIAAPGDVVDALGASPKVAYRRP